VSSQRNQPTPARPIIIFLPPDVRRTGFQRKSCLFYYSAELYAAGSSAFFVLLLFWSAAHGWYSLTHLFRFRDKACGFVRRWPVAVHFAAVVAFVSNHDWVCALDRWTVQSGQCTHAPRLHFLRAKAALLSARLSHRNSVRPSVCLSVTRVDQAKTVQGRISKSSPSAARKTLVSGTVKLFHKFEGAHPERGR